MRTLRLGGALRALLRDESFALRGGESCLQARTHAPWLSRE